MTAEAQGTGLLTWQTASGPRKNARTPEYQWVLEPTMELSCVDHPPQHPVQQADSYTVFADALDRDKQLETGCVCPPKFPLYPHTPRNGIVGGLSKVVRSWGGARIMGSAPYRRHLRELPAPPPCGDAVRRHHRQPQRELSPERHSASTLVSDLQPPERLDIISDVRKPPGLCTLVTATQTKQDLKVTKTNLVYTLEFRNDAQFIGFLTPIPFFPVTPAIKGRKADFLEKSFNNMSTDVLTNPEWLGGGGHLVFISVPRACLSL